VSRRKHGNKGAADDEQPEPIPDPQAVEGALWSEAGAASPESAAPGGTVAPAGAAAAASEPPAADLPEQAAAEIARLQGQAAEYLDGWQRARAEFANYKKRIEREQEEARGRVVGDLLQDFTAILDDLERALRDRPGDGDAGAWASGPKA
jgi:molecular chaperone GrpE